MTNEEIDVFMDEFVEEGLFRDIYDIKYKNDVLLDFDVKDKLSNVTAKSLIIGNTDDIFYSYKYDALSLKELINDSEIILYDSFGNPQGYGDHAVIIESLEKFLKEVR